MSHSASAGAIFGGVSGTNDGFGNQFIANTVEISGEGHIVINYDGRNPAPGNKVYLVE